MYYPRSNTSPRPLCLKLPPSLLVSSPVNVTRRRRTPNSTIIVIYCCHRYAYQFPDIPPLTTPYSPNLRYIPGVQPVYRPVSHQYLFKSSKRGRMHAASSLTVCKDDEKRSCSCTGRHNKISPFLDSFHVESRCRPAVSPVHHASTCRRRPSDAFACMWPVDGIYLGEGLCIKTPYPGYVSDFSRCLCAESSPKYIMNAVRWM